MPDNWTIFGRLNISNIFWTIFLVSIGLRIGQDLRNIRILHPQKKLSVICPYLREPYAGKLKATSV